MSKKFFHFFLAIRVRKCIKKWMSEFSKKFQTFHARSYPSQAMKISRGKIEELRSFERDRTSFTSWVRGSIRAFYNVAVLNFTKFLKSCNKFLVKTLTEHCHFMMHYSKVILSTFFCIL